MREQGWRPNGVVVGKDDDVGSGVLDTVAHLQTLIGERDGENAYTFGIDLVGEVLQRAPHFLLCDDENLFGVADKPAACGIFELVACIDGGHNDCDVFGGEVGRVVWEGNGAIGGGGGDADEVPEIAVETGENMGVSLRE